MDLDLPLKITELEYQIIIEMRVLQILSDTVCHCLTSQSLPSEVARFLRKIN